MNARREAPHHRNLTCYTDYRCRLPECVDRFNAAARARRAARRNGTYAEFVDVDEIRVHIRRLQRAGMHGDAIARTAGVSVHTVLDIARPRLDRRRPRRHRVTPATAAKILAVRPDKQTAGFVPAVGTIRRVQALVAIGYPVTHVSRRAGLSQCSATEILGRPRVNVSTAKAITAIYAELRDKRPDKDGVTKPHVAVAKNRAARNKWPTPKYWDQHPGAIDDPDFEPLYGVTKREIVAQDASELIRWSGLDRAAAAERLGVSKSYVEHAFREHPQYAIGVAA